MRFNGKNILRRARLWAILAVVFAAVVYVWQITQKPSGPIATIKGKTYKVLVADTTEERSRGLSGHTSLANDAGMLFIFDQPGKHCFWMKDMDFTIDILWFDSASKLIHTEKRASPASYPAEFCPPTDAKYVLEVNSGDSEKLGTRSGDELLLSNL